MRIPFQSSQCRVQAPIDLLGIGGDAGAFLDFRKSLFEFAFRFRARPETAARDLDRIDLDVSALISLTQHVSVHNDGDLDVDLIRIAVASNDLFDSLNDPVQLSREACDVEFHALGRVDHKRKLYGLVRLTEIQSSALHNAACTGRDVLLQTLDGRFRCIQGL